MKIVNNKRRSYGIAVYIPVIALLLALVVVRIYTGYSSGGLLCIALVILAAIQTDKGNSALAYADEFIISEPLERVDKLRGCILYNGKPLQYYKYVQLTHEPEPYADAEKRTLWLHPEHFNVSANARSIWEENGGVLDTATVQK